MGAARIFISRALAAGGVIQGYNLIARRNEIAELSQSVQYLAAWWHYAVSIPFKFIPIPFSPLERDLLALMLIGTTAASLKWRQATGFSVFELTRRLTFSPEQKDEFLRHYEQDRSKHFGIFSILIIYCVTITYLISTIIGRFTHIPFYYVIVVIIAMAAFGIFLNEYMLKNFSAGGRHYKKWLMRLTLSSILIVPLICLTIIAFVLSATRIISYRFVEIAWTAGIIFVLLGLSVLFKYVGDPYLLPFIANLPSPPAS